MTTKIKTKMQPALPDLSRRRRSHPPDARRRRSPHLFLVRRFAHPLFRHAQSLDQVPERRLQKRMERCCAISHRRTRRHHLRSRRGRRPRPPRRRTDERSNRRGKRIRPHSGRAPIATSPLRVEDLVTSPDGTKLAFLTNSINQRQEKSEDAEIFAMMCAAPSPASAGSESKPAAQPRR